MIISYVQSDHVLAAIQGIPAQLDRLPVWIEVNQPTGDELKLLVASFGIEPAAGQSSTETDIGNYLYIRSELLMVNKPNEPKFGKVYFILGEHVIVSINHHDQFKPFEGALRRLNRKPTNHASARAVLRVLLQVANDNADAVIDSIADELEQTSEEIFRISEGRSADGKELGVQDLLETIIRLNKKEELISRCLEAQLSLMRAVRYLNGEVDNILESELQILVSKLSGDVVEVKEHASFEYEKVRYLQNAVTNILNIKQNQIVKVFTIITAVFLPPTLVGTFYGMNFAVMPELSWEHGFIYSMLLTLAAAILPLAYIKHKGWLR